MTTAIHVTAMRVITALMLGLSVATGTAGAATAKEIDVKVDAALERFLEEVAGARAFLDKAEGVLVLPADV